MPLIAKTALVFLLLLAHSEALSAKKLLNHQLIYDSTKLHEVRIELDESDWDKLRVQMRDFSSAMAGFTESPYKYFRGTCWIDGVKIESVGIRKKGFFGSQDTERPSLKIKFDEYVKQDPAKGFDRLTLNNNKQDVSQVSQFLAYRLFNKAGVHAPRVSFAKVTVNGKYLGIYSNVEAVRSSFLKQRYGSKSGVLYEGTLTDFYTKSVGRFEAKTKKSKNRAMIEELAQLISDEKNFSADAVSRFIDLDNYLKFWAIESLIGFWDSYSSNQNNFFIYAHPKTGKLNFIPWGADSTFTDQNPMAMFLGAQRNQSVYATAMLPNRLYRDPKIPERYRQTMKMILAKHWKEEEMLAEVDRIEKLLAEHLHASQRGMPRALDGIRNFIKTRKATIADELSDKQWPVSIADEPRKPGYSVNVGSLKGTFESSWASTQTPFTVPVDAKGRAKLTVELDGEKVVFDQVRVAASPGMNFNRGFRGGQGATPATINFAGERKGGEPVTISLIVPREDFRAQSVSANGFLRVGSGNQFGFGGRMRAVRGKLTLAKAGLNEGDAVQGEISVDVIETKGGLFDRRRAPRTTERPSQPRPGAKERGERLQKALSLFRAQDKDGSGKISAKEWDAKTGPFKSVDSNKDGQVSLQELIAWLTVEKK